MSDPVECQCCKQQFIPDGEVKSFFPVLCWTCSHQVIADMAIFMRRSMKNSPSKLQSSICDYMVRKGLMGSILR